MNVFVCSGNLGRGAEVRHTPNGKSVLSFSLGVSSGWGDRKVTTWVRCNGWGERYTKLAQYLTKGSRVIVSGELSERPYETNGEQRKSLELNLNSLDLPPKGSGRGTADGSGTISRPEADQQGGQDFDDDIPFSRAIDPCGY